MRILFIGGGNMARALIGGVLGNAASASEITVVEPRPEARQLLEKDFGVQTLQAVPATLDVDVVVLAVKPQQLKQACTELTGRLGNALVLSIAAGVRIAAISRWLGGHGGIVRTMPNTPALVRAGITGLYAPASVDAKQREAATATMAAVGEVLWVEEEPMLDAVTALSGSGPAYGFYFMEAMEQAARDMGFNAEDARRLTVQTLEGACLLARQSDSEFASLRQQVTSKGGTTERALGVMSEAGVDKAILSAVLAARERATELADLMEKE